MNFTVNQALKKYPDIEIELLLAHVLKKPKEFLFLHPEHRPTALQARRLSQMIKRRQKGEPIAYILGYKDFMGYRLKVNRDVLIPRPETEELVRKVMEHKTWNMKNERQIRILDVGTGSGCIAVSLAELLPAVIHNSRFMIYASDISKKALKVARANAKAHKAKIRFIHSDILQNVGMSFDIIVANLPYVPKEYYASSTKHLGWEPKNALVDPVKDFNLYERFFKEVASLPSLPKAIFLEIDPSQKSVLSELIKKYLPKADIKFHRDFKHLWRHAVVTLPLF